MQYKLVGNEDGTSTIAVFHNGEIYPAHSDHPNFGEIVEGARNGDESVIDLFDIAKAAATKFNRLSERFTHANGRLFMDGVEITGPLAEQILRFIEEKVDNWEPLVKFYEKVAANPNEHSREQLYGWLAGRDFTIVDNGDFVAYKGVNADLTSIHSGRAIVNDQVIVGHIPNEKGSVIEMPRDEVQHDPSAGCHTGLHVGTHTYAEKFAAGALLEVHVNPRDVVSVPTEETSYDPTINSKMRVCRYVVVDTIDAPHTTAVVFEDSGEDLEDEWGDGEGEGTDTTWAHDLTNEDPIGDEIENLDAETDDSLIGTTWEDTDSRRAGRTFVVESIESDPQTQEKFAVGKSMPQNITRKVNVNRLYSRKYRQV